MTNHEEQYKDRIMQIDCAQELRDIIERAKQIIDRAPYEPDKVIAMANHIKYRANVVLRELYDKP